MWLSRLGNKRYLILICPFFVFYGTLFLDNLISEAGPKNDIIFLLLCCSGRLCFVPLPFNDSLLRCECFSKITITTLQIIFRSGFLFFQQSDKTEGG